MAGREGRSESTGDKTEQGGGFGEAVKIVVHALILALVVRTFAFQPFNIPSGSMMETLLVGDYLFVSKYAYGYSSHSFPYSIVPFKGRIFASEPKRGDIAVFKLPRDNSTDYIKRVIGLPGETVQVLNGLLYINGKPVQKEPDGEFVGDDRGVRVRAQRYVETLPNGVSYKVLELSDRASGDNTELFTVPEGHYFMMGDNRDNSSDSRASVGYVPFENFVGRAEIIFFSVKSGESAWQFWKWPWTARWSRFFDSL